MRFFIFFIFLFSNLFGYALVVNSKEDAKKMQKIGIECRFDKNNDFYVCTYSDDINQLRRVKDFLKSQYDIKAYITSSSMDSFSLSKEFKKPQKSSVKNKKLLKSGYCIQVISSKKSLDNIFEKYKNFPYARIEKINGFYVLRVGEGSYSEVKNLNKKIGGFIRKCDIVPQRIVKANFNVNNLNVKEYKIKSEPVINENILRGRKYTLKDMYNALNSGNLVEAQRIANLLVKKYPSKAYEVLGIIAMKKSKWYKACRYLTKANSKLKKDACYTYFIQAGYKNLTSNPLKAKKFFEKACKIKKSLDCEIGIGYVYLNTKEYKKAKDIFEKLFNKYPDNKNVIKGYVLALYNLKDYETLEKIKNILPKKYQSLLKDYEFEKKLNLANSLIKENRLKEAEEILLDLYTKNPSNIYVLLSLGNLYLKENELEKAEEFYKNVLLIAPDNIYALKGLKAIYEKRGDYKKALEYANKIESLGFEVEDKKTLQTLLYMQEIQNALKNNRCEAAKEYISVLKDLDDKKINYYLTLGDYYSKCAKNPKKAYDYYAKAYSLAPDNIDVVIKFLYSLLNFDMFEQIKIILAKLSKKDLSLKEKEKLKGFYKDLYLKYAAYLLDKKEYKKALLAADEGLKYGNDAGLYEVKGWTCFKLGDYKCAKDAFLMAVSLSPKEDTKFGLALTYIKLGENKKALKTLDEIANTKNPELRVKIAKAYLSLGEIKKAKMLMKTLKPVKTHPIKIKEIPVNKPENNEFFPDILGENSQKKKMFYDINKTYKNNNSYYENSVDFKEYKELKEAILLAESKRIDSVELEYLIRNKSGEPGRDKLYLSLLDLKGKFFFDFNKKFYFKFGFLFLDSKKPPNYDYIGSAYLKDANDTYKTTYKGFLAKVGYYFSKDNYFFNAELGSTPIGNNVVSSSLTGKIGIGKKVQNRKYAVFIQRDSVRDSILSYVGNIDPYTNKKWGRVIKNSLIGIYEKKLDDNDSLIYTSLSFSLLEGKHVKTNKNVEAIIYPYYYWGSFLTSQDYIGLFTIFSFYAHNENYFYFGNGGYFSPKYFMLFGPRYEGYYFNKKMGVKAFIMPGLAMYKEDEAQTTLNIDCGVYAKYLINNRLSLNAGFDIRYAKYFSDLYFKIGVEYSFGKRFKVFKNELNKELKGIIKIW